MSIKSNLNASHDLIDEVVDLFVEFVSTDVVFPISYYEAKKLLSKLKLVSK